MDIRKSIKTKFKRRIYWIAIANALIITGFRPFSNLPNSEHWFLIYGGIIMLLAAFLIPMKPKKISNNV